MTLLEVTVAFPIVLVSIGMFVQMLTGGTGMRDASREAGAAITAAQTAIEEMRNERFDQLLPLFNADPLDDPGGPGTAPGHRFRVDELVPLAAAADGMVGEIILPVRNAGSEVAPDWEIREDLVLPELGMPRDLNGDAVIDDLDHSDDVSLLPVVVVLRWQGRLGEQEMRVFTVMTELY